MLHQYTGRFEAFGFTFNITAGDGELLAAVPGVPVGYEIVMTPLSEHLFRMESGPFRGAVLEAAVAEDGVSGFQVGPFFISRVADDAPSTPRLLAPPLHLNAEKEAAFASLLAEILAGELDWIDDRLDYPKHEFIQYVMAQHVVLFHSSNRDDIDVFEPVRKSVELRDETGRGNQQGIYATHDGLWSMFFGVVNRGQLQGSIRNGVSHFQNRAGDELAAYNFSINQHQLADRPYCDGALYFLPRDRFTRLMLFGDLPSNEWVCREQLRPLARLRLSPEDFPFLEQIAGHDDGPLLRLNELSRLVREAATAAHNEDDHFVVVLPAAAAAAEHLDEYLALLADFMPGRYSLEPHDDQIHWIVQNPSPAQRQTLKDLYAPLIQ